MIPSHASALHAAIKQAVRLRYYQSAMVDEAFKLWDEGLKNLMLVLPTGGGKTVCMGSIVSRWEGAVCLQAHRQELVGQISIALARYGILHRLICPDSVTKGVIRQHVEEFGTHFVQQNSRVGVGGVDTLIRKGKHVNLQWCNQVTLVVPDEGHHLLRANKWGKAVDMFTHPQRKILTVSATPERPDGKGLGLHSDGYVEQLIEGPRMQQLIDEVYLTGFRIALPECDLKLTRDMFSPNTGELNKAGLAAMRGSEIVGDVVEAYKKFSPGKPSIAFFPDIAMSMAAAEEFRQAGVRALHVDGDSSDEVRDDAIRKLKRGDLDMVTNVDLFGEGFDLPSIFAVYDCAATESYVRFVQRFGRMLRLLLTREQVASWEDYSVEQRRAAVAASAKPYGLYVDLVGNLNRHNGPPTTYRAYSLDAREKRSGASAPNALTTCTNTDANGTGFACGLSYPRFRSKCPHCGFAPVPSDRSSPEKVDGDITLLDPETVAELWKQVVNVDAPCFIPHGLTLAARKAAGNKHAERIDAQLNLRDAFAWWAGERRAHGLTDQEIYKLFYLNYGLDVVSAWALGRPDADALAEKLDSSLTAPSQLARIRPENY